MTNDLLRQEHLSLWTQTHKMLGYIKGQPLGRGGFATVYAGVRRRDGMPVALKEIWKDNVSRWVWHGNRNIPMEIHLLLRSRHIPGVVRLVDWFEMYNKFVIVMERRDTLISLEKYLYEKGKLNETEAREVFTKVAFTIHNMMILGVYHRDIKPGNLLTDTENKDLKVIDLGCGDILHNGIYVAYEGTPDFMPPEQVYNNCYRGEPATVWSLGVLLFTLVSGSIPFHSNEDIMNGRFFVPSHVSQSCRELICMCLMTDPRRRASMNDILKHKFLHCY